MKNTTMQWISARRLARAALAVAVAGTCFLALAQAPPDAPGPQRQPRRHRMGPGGDWWNNPQTIEALGLDDATRSLIDEEVHQTKLRMIDLKAEAERTHLELQRMLHAAEAPSERETEDQVDRVVEAQGRIMKEEIMLRARVLALLTPTQRAELEVLHQNRRDAMRRDYLERRRPREPYAPEPPEPPEAP